MQNWNFLESYDETDTTDSFYTVETTENSTSKLKSWLFKVRVTELLPGEIVCVTGNIAALGKWVPEKCVPLIQDENDEEIWSLTMNIKNDVEVEYRYCVCMMNEKGERVVVRKWETNLKPRRIEVSTKLTDKKDEDVFGDYDNFNRAEPGWLLEDSIVQFKLFKNALTLWRSRYRNRTLYVKVTPVNLSRHCNDRPTTMAEALEESLSTDTQDVVESPKYAHTVVANLNANNSVFEPQGQFGKEYNPNDLLIFETSVLDLKNIAFLVDLYMYSSNGTTCEPPYHVGFSYLLPSALRSSEGHTVLPVTSVKHRPLGQVELDYLVIKPMTSHRCDMSVSYARHWKTSWHGLDVGHRGLGTSFKVETKNCAEVRENTIASLKTAASHGADFVEFDVQLSKDLVPIIYHDFHVCISMKRKKELDQSDMLELPVKELTLEQLHFLKVYHLSEGKARHPRFFDEDLEDHQPFPTLQQALEVLEPHVGFNVEIKRSNQLSDGSQELDHSLDINLYLDTILDVVLKYAGQRRIIFSCFNPDVCRMIRLKQNKYPVMFLTQGQTARYPNFIDPRCQTVEAAVQFAVCMSLLGVNVHTEDLLRDGSKVRLAVEAGLVIFCWGDDNNDPATIKHLKELGLHAVIYDKIDQYSSKEIKESIFLVEARESQRQLLLLAAANAEAPTSPPPRFPDHRLNVELARNCQLQSSAATSLESLDSQNSDKDSPSLSHT